MSQQAVKPLPLSTFAGQSSLKRLPIPNLKETADRYLLTVKACATPEEYAKTEQYVKDFVKPGGLGEKLQARLKEHDKTAPGSWLEGWWLQLAYLSWRESVLINSNWYMIVNNHPDAPKELLTEGHPSRKNGEVTQYQISRVAGAVSRFLDYKDLIDGYVVCRSMT
jgi:carnitine O-acetyltransferase